ncbi:hypothetical protein OBA28_02200 [Alphaproteobacteria bacterium]|nr:hypothetical protein [Alphaproteobacteria bacterium]
MYIKKFLAILMFTFCFSVNSLESAPPESSPKKWPCDQVYNPKLDLKAVWSGPQIDGFKKNWWKDDEVIEMVNKLSDPILSEDEGTRIIEDFAKKHSYFGLVKKKERNTKLINIFVGLFEKASQKRNKQYEGIIKFVERQDVIRKTIGDASKELRKYRKAGLDVKDPKFTEAEAKMKWNTRVFDQRTRLTEYVCEEPVFLEQRIGYQARKILTYLQ